MCVIDSSRRGAVALLPTGKRGRLRQPAATTATGRRLLLRIGEGSERMMMEHRSEQQNVLQQDEDRTFAPRFCLQLDEISELQPHFVQSEVLRNQHRRTKEEGTIIGATVIPGKKTISF